MITRKQALNALAEHTDLALVYELDTYRTEFLVDLHLNALSSREQTGQHASIDVDAQHIVGSIAACPELRTESVKLLYMHFSIGYCQRWK